MELPIELRKAVYDERLSRYELENRIVDFISKNYVVKEQYEYQHQQLETIHANIKKNIFGEDMYAEMGH